VVLAGCTNIKTITFGEAKSCAKTFDCCAAVQFSNTFGCFVLKILEEGASAASGFKMPEADKIQVSVYRTGTRINRTHTPAQDQACFYVFNNQSLMYSINRKAI